MEKLVERYSFHLFQRIGLFYGGVESGSRNDASGLSVVSGRSVVGDMTSNHRKGSKRAVMNLYLP